MPSLFKRKSVLESAVEAVRGCGGLEVIFSDRFTVVADFAPFAFRKVRVDVMLCFGVHHGVVATAASFSKLFFSRFVELGTRWWWWYLR